MDNIFGDYHNTNKKVERVEVLEKTLDDSYKNRIKKLEGKIKYRRNKNEKLFKSIYYKGAFSIVLSATPILSAIPGINDGNKLDINNITSDAIYAAITIPMWTTGYFLGRSAYRNVKQYKRSFEEIKQYERELKDLKNTINGV